MKKILIFLAFLICSFRYGEPADWVKDDLKEALSLAQQKKSFLFVDFWASWCYSCMFMKENILPLAEEKGYLKNFIKLEINTDNKTNFEFVRNSELKFWPTFMIVDSSGKELRRLQGENTLSTLKLFLENNLKGSGYGELENELKNLTLKGDLKGCLNIFGKFSKAGLVGCQELYLYETIISCVKKSNPDIKLYKNELEDIRTFLHNFLKNRVLSDNQECNDYLTSFEVPADFEGFLGNKDKNKALRQEAISFLSEKTGFNRGKLSNRGLVYNLKFFLSEDPAQKAELEKLLLLAEKQYDQDYYFATALLNYYRSNKNFSKALEFLEIAKKRAGHNLMNVKADEIELLIDMGKKEEAKYAYESLLKESISDRLRKKLEGFRMKYFK